MADNVAITPGTGATIATDEVSDTTLGTVQVQFTKIMDGTLDGTNKAIVDEAGALYAVDMRTRRLAEEQSLRVYEARMHALDPFRGFEVR